jgi:hypothetical protein
MGTTYDPACLRDPARASGPERHDYSARLHDSASNPARGLGATYDPAFLRDPARALGPGRRTYSARLRDSTSNPAQGLGVIYDLACLCDSARASGPDVGTARKVSVTQTLASGSGNRIGFAHYGYSEVAKG